MKITYHPDKESGSAYMSVLLDGTYAGQIYSQKNNDGQVRLSAWTRDVVFISNGLYLYMDGADVTRTLARLVPSLRAADEI